MILYRNFSYFIITLTTFIAFGYGFSNIGDIGQYRAQLLDGEIIVVNETTRIQNKYPNATNIGILKTKLVKGQINYELGKRIHGDKLVAEKAESQSFPSAQDVQIVLKYPTDGNKGCILTHVNIVVDQSSNVGDGYVIDGGIEKRYISILVEANNTLHFSYSASFYGY